MYQIKILNFEKTYLLNELIKIFLRPDQYELIEGESGREEEDCILFNEASSSDINVIKREIFDKLSVLTGQRPEWGILTGVRPVKLCGEIYERLGDADATVAYLMEN